MRESDQGGGTGKRGGADRQARLAAKLRQNLVRRKDKARAIGGEGVAMQIDAAASRPRGDAPDETDKGA